MKIILPEDISEITLNQYQRFERLNDRKGLSELQYNKRVIDIFTELKFRDIGNISNKDYEDILQQIIKAINKDVKFQNRFFIKDVEFGFVPNIDEITTAEFVDLSGEGLDIKDYHKIMAILFRPITGKDRFGNYEIENYRGTKDYEDIMKEMPMHIVNGALGFFYLLAKELRVSTQKSTREVQAKEVQLHSSLRNGGGLLA